MSTTVGHVTKEPCSRHQTLRQILSLYNGDGSLLDHLLSKFFTLFFCGFMMRNFSTRAHRRMSCGSKRANIQINPFIRPPICYLCYEFYNIFRYINISYKLKRALYLQLLGQHLFGSIGRSVKQKTVRFVSCTGSFLEVKSVKKIIYNPQAVGVCNC